LRRGATPAEALREVRADLARDEPELAPFLHALQQVVGLGHAPLFPREPEAREVDPSPSGAARRSSPFALATAIAVAFLAGAGLSLALYRRRRRASAPASAGTRSGP
jgi:hypothetical protein